MLAQYQIFPEQRNLKAMAEVERGILPDEGGFSKDGFSS